MSLTLPTSYFSPISQYALIAAIDEYLIEAKEHYVKQTYRNRFEIYGPNGLLSLSIPIKKWKKHSPIDKIDISFDENWQNLHWKSLESAYRASPFFEFYEEEIKPLVFLKENNLLTRNQLIEKRIKKMIGLCSKVGLTKTYEPIETDWRTTLNPKNKPNMESFRFSKYIQVFDDKHGFLSNLSILDLLFNLGPECKTYLIQLNQSIKNGGEN